MEKWIERYTLAKHEREQARLSFRRSQTTRTLPYPPELVLLPDFPTNKRLEQTILQAKHNGESISDEEEELAYGCDFHYRKFGAIWSRGRHFRVERIDNKRTTFDCGVKASFMQETRSSASNENAEATVDMLDYCGTLQDIIKVGFRKFDIFIFDVKWFKVVTQGPQVTVRKDKSGFLQVDRTKIWTDQRDTFVLPEHCEQVIFKEDPTDRRWLFVIQIDPRGRQIYEDVGNIEGENLANAEEMIPPNNAPIEQLEEEEEEIIVEAEGEAHDGLGLDGGILIDDQLQPEPETNTEEAEYDEATDLTLELEEDEDIDKLSSTNTRDEILPIDENEEIFLEIDLFGAMDLAEDDQVDDEL